MPVVPFLPTPPRERQAQEFTSAQEPWALMAAAQMDAEGRLVMRQSDNVEDRRGQGLKERDNEMVNDQQLPRSDWADYDKDTFGKLNRALGTSELDNAERDNIVEAVKRGLAARGR